MNQKKNYQQFIIFVLLAFLLAAISVFPSLKQQEAEQASAAEDIGGQITVDKYRDKYELLPGETTKVTLKMKADPVKVPKPITTILALDMSSSMVINESMEPTLTAARRAAEIITEHNGQVTDASKKAKIALVRYDSVASVYDFVDKKWLILDNLQSIESMPKERCYSADTDKIREALSLNVIASSQKIGNEVKPNNYPRKNTFYLATNFSKYFRDYSGNITGLEIRGYTPDPAIMTYYATDDIRDYLSKVKQKKIQGTNIEAGIYVTELVASKITDSDVYSIFMTDGVPTLYQFGGTFNSTAYSSPTAISPLNFSFSGLQFAVLAGAWVTTDGLAAGNLPDSQDPARTLAVAAGNRLQAKIAASNSRIKNVFAVGVNKGFSHDGLFEAQGDILYSLTGDRGSKEGGLDGRSFITDNPKDEITKIYESIAKTISADPITSPITVTDIVPDGFTLSASAKNQLRAQAASLGGTVKFIEIANQPVKIIWELPGLIPDVPVELSYDLQAKYGSYGILNTNQSATLQYDTFCPGIPELDAKDPNDKTIPFPKPQIKLQPRGGQNDHYVMPDNQTTYQLSNTAVVKKNVTGIDPRASQQIATQGKITGNDLISTRVDDGQAPGSYDNRTAPRPGDKVPERDRNVQPLKINLRPKTTGGEGTTSVGQIGKCEVVSSTLNNFELKYTPNPLRAPLTGYTVYYEYRYESTEQRADSPVYATPWYTITIEVPANQYRAKLQFLKQDEDGQPLSGAVFDLYKNNGSGQPTGAKLASVTTNAQGIGLFSNLLAGQYLLREQQAPAGYELDTAYHAVTITQAQQDSEQTVIHPKSPLSNRLKRGSITLKKINQFEAPVVGAEFALYAAADKTFQNPLQTAVSQVTTGIVKFEAVKPGKYYVKELAAPDGYQEASWVSQEIEITATGNRLDINLDKVVNQLIQPFDLEVTKIGADRELLEGAGFELLNMETEDTTQVSTHTDGRLTLIDLANGTYQLEEIHAPIGYQLLNSEYLLEISPTSQQVTRDGEHVDFEWIPGTAQANPRLKLTIANQRLPHLPKTGGVGRAVLMGAGGVGMVFGAAQLISSISTKRQKKRS